MIITDLPGQAEVVHHHRCGLVIPPESPEKLAEAVAWLYSHPLERKEMGQRGREAILKYHSWDQRAGRTDEVLRGVL